MHPYPDLGEELQYCVDDRSSGDELSIRPLERKHDPAPSSSECTTMPAQANAARVKGGRVKGPTPDPYR